MIFNFLAKALPAKTLQDVYFFGELIPQSTL